MMMMTTNNTHQTKKKGDQHTLITLFTFNQ